MNHESSLINPEDILNDNANTCKQIFKSLHYSCKCRMIYIFLLICSTCLGGWVLYYCIKLEKPSIAFYTLESIVNFILICDVLISLWIKGCHKYWHNCTDAIEFFLVFACAVCTILSIVGKNFYL